MDKQWIKNLIQSAITIKNNPQKYSDTLKNMTLIMLFQKTSTRTRVSFEVAMTQLGGHAIFLDYRTTQLGTSALKDEARVLSRYGDIIIARLLRHKDLKELAKYFSVPVINGLYEKYHPCQILGDLMTIYEKKAN